MNTLTNHIYQQKGLTPIKFQIYFNVEVTTEAVPVILETLFFLYLYFSKNAHTQRFCVVF